MSPVDSSILLATYWQLGDVDNAELIYLWERLTVGWRSLPQNSSSFSGEKKRPYPL